MKKVTLLLMVIAVAVITGCGKKASDSSTSETESSSQIETVDENEEQNTIQDEEAQKLFWDEYEGDVNGTLYLEKAQSFSEGVTWVTVAAAGSANQTMLIDETGKMLYKRPVQAEEEKGSTTWRPESITTNFSHGVGFLRDKNDEILVNTKGEVVWSLQEDGWSEAERLFGKEGVEEIRVYVDTRDDDSQFFNGYLVVEMDYNTFEGSGTARGILKPDGTWLIAPQDIEIQMSVWCNIAALFYTVGNESYYKDEKAIQLDTGEIYDVRETTYDANGDSVPGEEPLNGLFMVYSGQLKQSNFDVTDEYGRDYTARAYVNRWKAAYERSKAENLLYDRENQVFVDENWDTVVDLSEYIINNDKRFWFKNGYCYLNVENPDGAEYYTVIDKKGNRVFEPQKNKEAWSSAYVTDDRFLQTEAMQPEYYAFAESSANEEEGAYYIDLATGQPIETIHYPVMYPYVDGIALVKDSNEHYLFIDKEGEDLFSGSR